MKEIELLCPACGMLLEHEGGGALFCATCARRFPCADGILDLRPAPGRDAAPWPLEPGDLGPAVERLARGAGFKETLEELLLELTDKKAARLMQVLREGRGAWLTLLRAGCGRALFAGNALSGAITPLARFGFDVTVADASPERVRFGRYRDRAHNPGRTRSIVAGGPRLPFADASFDLVVIDAGGMRPAPGPGVRECLRVCAGELLLTADNRLAYKRPHGPHDEYRVADPASFVRRAVVPRANERTLRGWRRLLSAPGFDAPRAYALYPHAKQFTNVVALDDDAPELLVGPKERRNRLKLVGRRLGLFPVLTPSFALVASRSAIGRRGTRLERILDALAERIGEPVPAALHVLGTRGNSSVIHTRPRPSKDGADAGEDGADAGRWTLHVPLCPKNEPQLALHYRTLALVHERFPGVPVPEPLFQGEVEGVWLTCERRLRGYPAPQFCGDRERIARTLRDAARHLAALVVHPPAPLDDEDLEEQIGRRIDLAARYAAVESTVANLARLRAELFERLRGKRVPRVLYHADLRAKHVQVDGEGRVLGYLDWGTAEPAELPGLDLLHLLVHERKQAEGLSAGEAWRIFAERKDLRDEEREALAGYARAVGIDDETAQALERFYPAAVAAMAEKNWDYSRPRWLHRQFGI